jgi:hypothetical protein
MVRAADVSVQQRALLDLCQRLNFGSVLDLPVEGGEPVLEPPPRVIREFKFGGESGPRPETQIGDFALKRQQVELLQAMAEIGDGVIERLEVKHGLPFRLIVAERA